MVWDRPSADSRMKRFHLGDAELDMLSGGRELPRERGRDALAFEGIRHRFAREQAPTIDPRPEIGRDRHVRRCRYNARRERRPAARDLVEQRAKPELRRRLWLDRDRELLRHLDTGCVQAAFAAGGERNAVEECGNALGRLAQAFERVPFVTLPDVHRSTKGFHLRRSHQPGMVVLVAGERQADTFDRVGDEADRPVVIDPVESLSDCAQIVAAEIAHELRQFVIAAGIDKSRHSSLVADLVGQTLAPRRATLEYQRGIKLVRTRIDPAAQHLAARFGEGSLLQRAVFENHHVPAEIAEQIFVAFPQTLAHHRVEALPVVVDDPPAIAQALLPAFEQSLEDIALVELGVAEKRNHAAFRPLEPPTMGAYIILHQGSKQRLRHA